MARIILNDPTRTNVDNRHSAKAKEITFNRFEGVISMLRKNKSQKLKLRSKITQLIVGTTIIGICTVACVATGNYIIGGVLFTSFVTMFMA